MPKSRLTMVVIASLAVVSIPGTAQARHGHHRRGHNQTMLSGTVASFQGGVLTIKLADNTTASAPVTPATEIECQAPESSGAAAARIADHGGSGAGQNNPSGRGGDGPAVEAENEAVESPAQDAAEVRGQDDQATVQSAGSTGAAPAACDSTTLVPGTTVTSARIRGNGSGAPFFQQIKLAV